ncbi:hypothetical protein FNF31_02293 [Cafeteria roenbergensis]|uniref:Peptidyl-prolyl cis-trans isomerase n=1 Tax=Cafeteria roenbergensis TaxID=33653 RepID=A0A5A8DHB0_CAFRO|nr:hypothetical protein FNF28_04464 [Cafeteria roenbergensis]KAA0164756.1 hypothetical protein FNF31_02293 [Cafeteria roenbergensis]
MASSAAPQARGTVFLDLSIGGNAPERVEFRLFDASVPKTAANFRALCTGSAGTDPKSGKRLHYKGSLFHRVIPGFMLQGGDVVSGDGRGCASSFGGSFPDEDLSGRHDRPFLLSMANSGPNTNGCQFFVTLAPAPHLNGVHVIFGEALTGQGTLRRAEMVETDAQDRPAALESVRIVDCGEWER